jgi:ABC-type branched-subunit amino acid transport system substrate-binding protein
MAGQAVGGGHAAQVRLWHLANALAGQDSYEEASFHSRHRGTSVIAVIMLVAVAACSSSGSSGGSGASGGSDILAGPIKFGEISTLSGSLGVAGNTLVDAVKAAVTYFNAHNSIDGHKISLEVENDKGDPATGVNDARDLVSQDVNLFVDTDLVDYA